MKSLSPIVKFSLGVIALSSIIACSDDEVVQQERDAELKQEVVQEAVTATENKIAEAVIATESKIAEVTGEQDEVIEQFRDVLSAKFEAVRAEGESIKSENQALQERVKELEESKEAAEKIIKELKEQQETIEKDITKKLVNAIENTL